MSVLLIFLIPTVTPLVLLSGGRNVRLAVAAPATASRADTQPSPHRNATANPCAPFLYIPPSLSDRVLLYHSFSLGADRPEINRIGANLLADAASLSADGLTGPAYAPHRPAGPGRAVELRHIALPLNHPLTVSLWWRLDAPMKDETGYSLASLRTDRGYISNFVRGKGTWCALTRPTYVIQVYRFPGVSNVNGIYSGHAWVAHGVWHHTAVTVSAGARVRVYWDGRTRSDFAIKGRLFTGKDVVRAIGLGTPGRGHPMTIDEVLVLDRALTAEEIAAYIAAVRHLHAREFPFRERKRRASSAAK